MRSRRRCRHNADELRAREFRIERFGEGESIDILVRFVSGEAEGAELQAALQTPQLERVLGHFEDARKSRSRPL